MFLCVCACIICVVIISLWPEMEREQKGWSCFIWGYKKMSVCVHAHVCIGKSLCPCFPTHRLLEPHLEGISWKGWRAWKIKKHLKHSKIFKLSKQIGCVKYTSLHCRNVKLENLWNMHPSFPFSPFLALPHSFGLICSYDVTFSIKKVPLLLHVLVSLCIVSCF